MTEPAVGQDDDGWTLRTLKILMDEREHHAHELRLADQRALEIKAQGDHEALVLARDLKIAEDKVRNNILDQWRADRSTFATKGDVTGLWDRVDVAMKPLQEFVSTQSGVTSTRSDINARFLAILVIVTSLVVGLAAVISPHIH